MDFIWIFLGVAFVWGIYKGIKGQRTKGAHSKEEATSSAEAPSAPKPKAKRSPVPIDSSMGKKRKPLDYELYSGRIDDGKARAVLHSLDAHVPAADDMEAEDIATLVDECFAALTDDIEPQKVMDLYDDLAKKSPAFAAVTANGATDEMRQAFEESLSYVPQKNAKKIAIQIARSGHPLVAALDLYSYAMSDFLHLVAQETVDGWDLDDLPALPEGEICAKLCDLLEGTITADQLQAEFATLEEDADREACKKGLVRVKGSERGSIYEVDLKNAACTCPDWQKRRADVARDQPDRLCKHLVRLYEEQPNMLPPALARYAPLFPALDGRGMPCKRPDKKVYYGERNGVPYIFAYEAGKPWANLYVDEARYGYNDEEGRWSYGRPPEDADFWAQELKKFVAS